MSEELRRWAAMVTGDDAARRAAVAAHLKRCLAHTAEDEALVDALAEKLRGSSIVDDVLDEDHLPEICL